MENKGRLKCDLKKVDVFALGAVACWLISERPDIPNLDNVVDAYFDTHWKPSTWIPQESEIATIVTLSMMKQNPKERYVHDANVSFISLHLGRTINTDLACNNVVLGKNEILVAILTILRMLTWMTFFF